jgi:hypothetical protein
MGAVRLLHREAVKPMKPIDEWIDQLEACD